MSPDNQPRFSKGPNLADILLYLLLKWPWYLLSLLICLSFAWYRSATAPQVFYAQTKGSIYDRSRQASTGGVV
ncbi:MAG: hypothetical protein K2N76_03510, partial [Muribaculaceae bacterium]|nr:hypothetical protein [Muribaculaceae bacterium]